MRLIRIPLRISLVGGGSDIPSHYEKHGGAVVSFTIDKYIYITAKPNVSLFPNRYRLVYSKVEECNDRSEIKHPIIKQLVDDYGLGSLDLDVMSDIPAGTGMGSSSAFTVGLHRALWNAGDTKHGLAAQACFTELNDLKEPIGKQDQYAAAFGGLNYIQFNGSLPVVNPILLPEHLSENLKQHMHLVYVGGSRSASQQLTEQSRGGNTELLNEMSGLAERVYETLKIGDFERVGKLIRRGWEYKKQLSPNISTPAIDNIIDTALKHGATGGKLLGAGGAGFVLLFCPLENTDKMLNGLKPLNLTYVPFNFDQEGCRVLYED